MFSGLGGGSLTNNKNDYANPEQRRLSLFLLRRRHGCDGAIVLKGKCLVRKENASRRHVCSTRRALKSEWHVDGKGVRLMCWRALDANCSSDFPPIVLRV
jgi:hypothetical protein